MRKFLLGFLLPILISHSYGEYDQDGQDGQDDRNITFISDPGVAGPPLEVAHAYYGQWPAGLDPSNVYDGRNNVFAVGELTSLTKEVPYPNLEINQPPGGAINYSTVPPTGKNYQDYLIGVQGIVVDALDRLWILDTGRVLTVDNVLLQSVYGGPKLIGVNLENNTVFRTIVFPPTVAFGDSYLNDVRFDLRPSLGEGFAYITDSSAEGHNALIVVDLGSGESWRHLSLITAVKSISQFLPFVWGEPLYYAQFQLPYSTFPIGGDGIALSADGETLYWGPFASRFMYSCPTAKLRKRGESSELLAQQSVTSSGQKGVSDGLETDSNNMIYVGNNEANAINMYNPFNGSVFTFVRDPRINWVDTMSVAEDGFIYFTVNQFNLGRLTYPKIDRRKPPFALFRAKLPNGGTKALPKS
ncbi:MRJP-domain-containing protein [Daldinia bambusicola]|nr:MRJP-domain-containing protein [Daldinia bambusicola]